VKNVGRNDPCPCGSGKKYKKCHGASNVIEITPTRYNIELQELHMGLVEFAMNEYEFAIKNAMEDLVQPDLYDDMEHMHVFMEGLMSWIILYEPIIGEQTIFEFYYNIHKNKVKNERVKRTFSEWGKAAPSIYKVSSATAEWVTVKDVRTDETYKVSKYEEDIYKEGNLLTGILIPYIQEYDFLGSALELLHIDEKIINLAEQLNNEEMTKHYPDILSRVITLEIEPFDLEWDNPLHEIVIDLFVQHGEEKYEDENILSVGLYIWSMFTMEENPVIKKPQAYAAALDYVIQHEVLMDPFQSQKDLAEEYNVSATTISKHFRKIISVVGQQLETIISKAMAEMEDTDEEFAESFSALKELAENLSEFMEEQEFESEEEAEQFLDDLLRNQNILEEAPISPRDRAQDKLNEAQKEKGAKRKRLIKEALDIYPNSPDAYLLLGRYANIDNERYQYFHQAVIAGEKDLGEAFFRKNKGHFWMIPETKPYMRAKAAFALFQYHFGDKTAAIEDFQEMLELNPNDNQGMREYLLHAYIEEGNFDDAKALINRYEHDVSASFMFNHALLNFYCEGLTAKTKSLLKKANQQNPYVRDYLIGKNVVPEFKNWQFSIGDNGEAVNYVQENIQLWKEAASLLTELGK